jgi:hypothetical protein
MNVTVYLFGEFNNGYAQYPDDYTVVKFNKFYTNSKSISQIVIHREGNLMYYGYVRKLEQGRYIGFCVVINGLMLTKLEGLFSLFENAITNLVTNGQLIHFNVQGNIVTNVDKLYLNLEEIDLISDSFRNGIHRIKHSLQSLPAVSYGVSKDSVKNFSIEDSIDEIIKSSYTYGYTFVYKSKGYDTSQLNSYKGILSRLNNEKIELERRYDKLEKEHEETLKQKKQYQFVAVLFLIVLGCAIGLIFLNDNLNNTKSELQKANKNILELKDSISSKNIKISNLEYKNKAFELRYQQAENNLAEIRNLIEERQPLFIKSTSFNFSTGLLSVSYHGFRNEFIKLQVRAYREDGYSYNSTTDVNVFYGDNNIEIYLGRNLDSQKWYSFEILNGNIILGGDRH